MFDKQRICDNRLVADNWRENHTFLSYNRHLTWKLPIFLFYPTIDDEMMSSPRGRTVAVVPRNPKLVSSTPARALGNEYIFLLVPQ